MRPPRRFTPGLAPLEIRSPRITAILLAAALAGCVVSARRPEGTESAGTAAEPVKTEVRVTNHNWANITVYIVHAGARAVRLGLVTSMTTRTFTVPADVIGYGRNLYLLADPVGALAPFVSEQVEVRPGDLLDWRLENNLEQSALSVR